MEKVLRKSFFLNQVAKHLFQGRRPTLTFLCFKLFDFLFMPVGRISRKRYFFEVLSDLKNSHLKNGNG